MYAFAMQVVTAFNLVCIGTAAVGPTSSDIAIGGGPTEPYAIIYRVDLARGRWCFNDCGTTYPFASVTESQLVFQDDDGLAPTSVGRHIEAVNRETGRLVDMTFVGSNLSARLADCTRAEFTGFPAQRF